MWSALEVSGSAKAAATAGSAATAVAEAAKAATAATASTDKESCNEVGSKAEVVG